MKGVTDHVEEVKAQAGKGISYIVEHSTAMMFRADFIWL
jgi:hypothetical protein